jgi:hypothetical protein
VNEAAQIVYLAHPRTASHATALALSKLGFSFRCKQHHAPLDRPLPADWLVVTTVRNHFDALVSWYEARYSHSRPFDVAFIEFLLARHPYYFPNPTALWGLHTPHATDVVHWELLEPSLNRILGWRNLGPLTVASTNVGERRGGRSYQLYYDDEARAYVESRFALEMVELGYQYDD